MVLLNGGFGKANQLYLLKKRPNTDICSQQNNLMMVNWSNWAGTVENTAGIAYPESETEIVQILQTAHAKGQTVRPVGSGHSFSPLCQVGPEGLLLSLDRYTGIVSVDLEKKQVRARAGTKLRVLNNLLFEHGMAMQNLGDIDIQGIAGALTTGTHGTGTAFGVLATQIVALRLICPNGEILDCSATQHPDVFKAAQVSLGVLGIISEITLQCAPVYTLELTTGKAPLDEVIERYQDYNAQYRNFEYYWFPNTQTALTKCTKLTDLPPAPAAQWTKSLDAFLENEVFGAFCKMARLVPAFSPSVCNIAAAVASSNTKRDYSHRIYATVRNVRFYEMEYNIPIEHFQEVKRAIVTLLEKKNFMVPFPLEVRFVQQDDIWLSPAYGRQSAYIAAHQFKGMEYKGYFAALEEIFVHYSGRPHWGKMNTRTGSFFAETYPCWSPFNDIRRKLDPKGMMLNDYLKGVFC